MTSSPGTETPFTHATPGRTRPDRARFTLTRLRAGYHRGEVDALLTLVEVDLARPVGTLSGDFVHSARFTVVHLTRGYDMAEVDDHLDTLAEALTEHGYAALAATGEQERRRHCPGCRCTGQ